MTIRNTKRLLSLLLSLVMAFSLLSTPIYADEDDTGSAVEESTDSTDGVSDDNSEESVESADDVSDDAEETADGSSDADSDESDESADDSSN